MLSSLRYLLLGLHFVIGSFLCFVVVIFRPFHPTNSQLAAKIYSWGGLKIIGMRTEAENVERLTVNQPCVVVANHQSNWDLFVVGSIVPKRTVSLGKKSLKWVPFFGQIYWLAGNVLIDRGNRKKALEAIEVTKTALKEKNTSIWIFAEGTRNHGKNMLPFKKGAFHTAIHAGVPIVPVCCNSYLEGFDLNRWNNGVGRLNVLEPVETKHLTLKDVDQLMVDVHLAMMDGIQALNEKGKTTVVS